MLKLLTSTLAILSSSFSSHSAVLTAGDAVKVPIEVFHRRPEVAPPLSGSLWLAKDNHNATLGRAVLILRGPDHTGTTGFKKDHVGIASSLQKSGFNVLELDVRDKSAKQMKVLVEDIQSGVAFLKTDPRIEASRVLIVGAGVTADGVVHYASANKQMARIVDGIALVNLSDTQSLRNVYGIPALLVDPRKNVEGVCQTHCRTVTYKSKLGSEFKKTLVDFLLKPHG